MPWQEESTMQLRRQFIQDVQSGATPITELCAAYGDQPEDGLQVAHALRGGRPAGAGRSVATPADLADRDAAGAGARPARGAAPPPHLGAPETAAPAAAADARRALARAQHDRLTSAPRRAGRDATPGPPPGPSRPPPGADGRAQCHLDRGLQGPVQARGWPVLLSPHGGRWLQPPAACAVGRSRAPRGSGKPARLPARLSGVRPARAHPLR